MIKKKIKNVKYIPNDPPNQLTLVIISAIGLYALINNILSNAIEASIKIKDESSRIIDFNLREEKGLVILEVLNYFNKDESNSNASSSSKVDDSMPHDYGVKSIKYICKMYDGIYKQTINGNIFITNITFEKNSKIDKSQANSN